MPRIPAQICARSFEGRMVARGLMSRFSAFVGGLSQTYDAIRQISPLLVSEGVPYGETVSFRQTRCGLHLAGLHLLLTGHVHAILADRGKDFAGDPVLELTGLRFVGAHDELVETGLGNGDQTVPTDAW